jgi:ribosome maturation factor RimP
MGYMPIFCLYFQYVVVVKNNMASVQESITQMLDPVVASLGFELWGVEYIAQGRQSVLRIYIDKEEGISVDDCAIVSRQAGSVLDVEDPIKSEYTLEVSSPGMDRPLFQLKHYQSSIGERIALRLRMAFEGRRKFTGLLKGIEDEQIILEVDNEEYVLPYESIDKANIVPHI